MPACFPYSMIFIYNQGISGQSLKVFSFLVETRRSRRTKKSASPSASNGSYSPSTHSHYYNSHETSLSAAGGSAPPSPGTCWELWWISLTTPSDVRTWETVMHCHSEFSSFVTGAKRDRWWCPPAPAEHTASVPRSLAPPPLHTRSLTAGFIFRGATRPEDAGAPPRAA